PAEVGIRHGIGTRPGGRIGGHDREDRHGRPLGHPRGHEQRLPLIRPAPPSKPGPHAVRASSIPTRGQFHLGPFAQAAPVSSDPPTEGDPMRTLLNIIWLVLAGFWMFVAYAVAGVILCVLIITIPWGIASFRIGR